MRALIAAAALVAVAPPSWAAECAPYDAIRAELLEKFGEAPTGRGMDRAGMVAELFVNRETGTWTMVYTSRDGSQSCVVGHGSEWADAA